MHSFIQSPCIHSSIHSCIHSFIYSFRHSFIHSFTHSLCVHCVACPLLSFSHSFSYSVIQSAIQSFNHAFSQSVSQSVSHSFRHSVSQSFSQTFSQSSTVTMHVDTCRSAVGAYSSARYGQGSSWARTWLDNVRCVGDEARLLDCPANALGNEDCSHFEDAGVSCDTSQGRNVVSSVV